MSQRQQDLEALRGIEGDLRSYHVEFLYTAGKDWIGDEGVIVEIGSWRGLSTSALALGSMRGKGVPVYSIDPHEDMAGTDYGPDDWQAFYSNLIRAGVAHMVRPIGFGYENVAWPVLPVALAFIDVHPHTQENTAAALDVVMPFLTENAVIVLDDSLEEGVAKVVEELSGIWEVFAEAERVKALRRKWGVHDERELVHAAEAEASRQADEAEAPGGGDHADPGGTPVSDEAAPEPAV